MRAVHMEWTKLRTLPGTAWSLLALAALTAVGGGVALVATDAAYCGGPCDYDLTRLSLTGVYLGQLAVVALAAATATAEYDTTMVRATLTAYPRRLVVLGAKALVVSAAVLGTGVVTAAGAWLLGRFVPPAKGFRAANGYPALSLGDEPVLRAFGGTVLYLGLIALLSLGVGMALRHTAGAISGTLALLYVAPIVAQLLPPGVWKDRVLSFAPMPAGLAIQATRHIDTLPIGPWQGLGILAAYAGGALLLGAVLFRFRDA